MRLQASLSRAGEGLEEGKPLNPELVHPDSQVVKSGFVLDVDRGDMENGQQRPRSQNPEGDPQGGIQIRHAPTIGLRTRCLQ